MVTNYEEKYQRRKVLSSLKHNMALFGRICFPTALRKAVPRFHHEIYKALMDYNIKRVLIAAPRGLSKSTVASLIYPLWNIAFKKSDEDLFIVIISESQTQSINFLSRIKYHLNNSCKFKQLFGDYSYNTAKRWTNSDIILRNGTRLVAVGTGQRVRGFIEGDTRPNIIIVDDFESELNAYTMEGRTKNRKWMTEGVIPSLADDGKIVDVGTVISDDCFLMWAKESPSWKVLWYAIVDENNKSIWEERFPMERIKQIEAEYRAVGNMNGFYQEYMNIPQSPESAPFKPEYVKLHSYHYSREEEYGNCLIKVRGDKKEIIPVNIYCGVDPASSLAARADFFVIVTIGIDADNNKYYIDIFRQHISPAIQPDKIIETYIKYKPVKMKIETTAYQEALRASVKAIMSDKGLYIPGLEKGVKPRSRKSERLLSLVPMLAKGEFYFRSEDLTAQQEFLSYPKGRHDDIIDATWTALEGARPCRTKISSKSVVNKKDNIKYLDWMTM